MTVRSLFYLLLCCLWGYSAAFADQRPVKKDVPQKTASVSAAGAKLRAREFDRQKLETYRDDPDYNYQEGGGGQTWWEKFRAWLRQVLSGLLPEGHLKTIFFKYAVISIAMICIIYGILKLTGMDLAAMISGKPEELAIPYSSSPENIHLIDFDAEIEDAMRDENYRLAVRLLYLRSLKRLNDLGMIAWQPGKTNRAYLDEMDDAVKRQLFGALTLQFEYAWYGNFIVDRALFGKIRESFRDFNERLK